MSGQHCKQYRTEISYEPSSSYLPKFPGAEFFDSIEDNKNSTEIVSSKQDTTDTTSPYDDLHSFTVDAPENELSTIEYITDNQFESCSDSELGTPTPSVRDHLSSEMFIAKICESSKPDLQKNKTITKCSLEKNNKTIMPSVLPVVEEKNEGQGKFTEENPLNSINNDENIGEIQNDIATTSSFSESKSKVTEVNVNLTCMDSSSSSESTQESVYYQEKSDIICANKVTEEPDVTAFHPSMQRDENDPTPKVELCETLGSNSEELSMAMNVPSQKVDENVEGNGFNNTKECHEISDIVTVISEHVNQHSESHVKNENYIANDSHVPEDTQQILYDPSYKNVQEQVRNIEKAQNASLNESKLSKSLITDNECHNDESTKNCFLTSYTETEYEDITRNDTEKSAHIEDTDMSRTQELTSELLESSSNLTSTPPVPPPRASSKYVIPPPIPPFIEEDEDECIPEVPPLPNLLSISSRITSPLPPQRQYLLVPIDHFNGKQTQQISLTVPPSPPQRTTSYKKFINMTPTHTTHHSPESLKLT